MQISQNPETHFVESVLSRHKIAKSDGGDRDEGEIGAICQGPVLLVSPEDTSSDEDVDDQNNAGDCDGNRNQFVLVFVLINIL